MDRLVLEFRKEKETTGTFRYQELEDAVGSTTVGSIYVKKTTLGEPPPERLLVTIEDAAASAMG